MSAPFLPSCRAMLRGGLPHREREAALARLLQATPEILGWPLLPGVSGNEQTAAHAAVGLAGVALDEEQERLTVDRNRLAEAVEQLALAYLRDDVGIAEIPETHAAGLYGLLRLLNTRERRPYAIKGQVVGPISLSLLLTDADDRPLADNDSFREALLHLTSLRINWQLQLMQGYADFELVLVEEPFLHALGNPFSPLDWDDADELLARLFSVQRRPIGLGTRGECVWETVLSWPIDLLCFEYSDGRSTLLHSGEALSGFLRRGGLLGWGVVPSGADELERFNAERAAADLAVSMRSVAVQAGIDEAAVRRQSLITTTGGLGMGTTETAERALAGCAVISRRLSEGVAA